MTEDLHLLADWLSAAGCTHVAIESTGVYSRPVFNLLEGRFEVLLVNAQHRTAVPGRKTDVRDCEWLCDLLRHGLLRASFIPPLHIRELRELTRHRQTLVRDHGSVANRIQKLIESANIKLGQVATNALGLSGKLMLQALAEGEQDAGKLALLAKGRLRAKTTQLKQSLVGSLTPAQRFLLKELLLQYDQLQGAIDRVSHVSKVMMLGIRVVNQELDYRVMQFRGSGITDRASLQPLDPGAEVEVVALDPARPFLARVVAVAREAPAIRCSASVENGVRGSLK